MPRHQKDGDDQDQHGYELFGLRGFEDGQQVAAQRQAQRMVEPQPSSTVKLPAVRFFREGLAPPPRPAKQSISGTLPTSASILGSYGPSYCLHHEQRPTRAATKICSQGLVDDAHQTQSQTRGHGSSAISMSASPSPHRLKSAEVQGWDSGGRKQTALEILDLKLGTRLMDDIQKPTMTCMVSLRLGTRSCATFRRKLEVSRRTTAVKPIHRANTHVPSPEFLKVLTAAA